ncbi:MAG: hypothetical protein Q9M13_03115 [Mariprofundales bacterium]|nr:hypothetical protein [Mariprofundales bacterium]
MSAITLYDLDVDRELLHLDGGSWCLLPVEGRAMLRHIAGFAVCDSWSLRWHSPVTKRVRYWFDSWPQPWMGLTVAEELAFGQAVAPAGVDAVLAHWQLDQLSRHTPLLELTRFDAVSLMLARAELGDAELLLMEQPDAALSDEELCRLSAMLRQWLQQSGAMAVITTSRRWSVED